MNTIDRYIDLCIIDEYVTKDFENGYSFDIESLKETQQNDFLLEVMKKDNHLRDLVLSHLQELVDERLAKREVSDRFDHGFSVRYTHDGDSVLLGNF